MKADKQELYQRLKELYCSDVLAMQISHLLQLGDSESARLLLRRHRKQLMEDLHNSAKRVDDLDFLVYQIDKKKV